MKNEQKLNTLSLIAVTFFLVSGGPHGLEESMKKSGYALAMLSLIIVPVIWALPPCLLVGELAAARLPKEGGLYGWARRALGPRWAFMLAWFALSASIFDMGLYPNMFWDYTKYALRVLGWLAATDDVEHYRYVACAAVVIPGVLFNLRGSHAVGSSSKVTAILLLIPFAVLIGLVIYHRQPIMHEAIAPPPVSAKNLLGGIVVSMWNYMGWDNASTIASEVDDPQRTYPRAMFITIALIAFVYIAPVAAMLGTGIPYRNWENGYWVEVGTQYGGAFLGLAIALAGMISAFQMFQDLVMTYTRLPVVLARDGWLPKCFMHVNRHGAPVVAILVFALLWTLSSLTLKFDRLLTLDVVLYGGCLMIGFAALIALRIREPKLFRPFRIPLNVPGLIVMACFPLGLIGCALYSSSSERIFGWNAVHFTLGVAALGAVFCLFRHKHYREGHATV